MIYYDFGKLCLFINEFIFNLDNSFCTHTELNPSH